MEEIIEKLSIEFTEQYAIKTKTNYDVNLEQDLYRTLKKYVLLQRR